MNENTLQIFSQYYKYDFNYYHLMHLLELDKQYGFARKKVLDVGGSNIPVALARELHIGQLVCIEPISKYNKLIGVKNENWIKDKQLVQAEDLPKIIDSYSYVLDTEFETSIEAFYNYFDIILSFSTFEHVHDIAAIVDNMHAYVKDTGLCFITYEPIWSSAVGHHIWIDGNINFSQERNLDWSHLLNSKDDFKKKYSRNYPPHILNKLVYQMYDSPIINRKTFNEHLLSIFNSHFNNYIVKYWVLTPLDCDLAEKLSDKYGKMRYDVRGIALILYKCTLPKPHFLEKLLNYSLMVKLFICHGIRHFLQKHKQRHQQLDITNNDDRYVEIKSENVTLKKGDNDVTIKVKVKNLSNYTISSYAEPKFYLSCHLFSYLYEPLVWDGPKKGINIAPGQTYEVFFTFQSSIDCSFITFLLVCEGQFWLDKNTLNTDTISVFHETILNDDEHYVDMGVVDININPEMGKSSARISIRNLVNTPITSSMNPPFFLSYHLFDASGKVLVWDGNRSELDIVPSGEEEVCIAIPDDISSAAYITFVLLREGVFWLDKNPKNTITVDIERKNT